jgi:thioredoxin-like negative regulator of GroEL
MITRRMTLTLAATLLATTAAIAQVVPYSSQQFQSDVTQRTVVVHVHADWCPTCRQQAPTLQSMASDPDFADVRFVRVNFDTDKDFLTAHRVAGQSTILVFRGGREVSRFVGVTNAQQLRDRITAAARSA